MCAAQASAREEQLLHNIRGALEAKNYAVSQAMLIPNLSQQVLENDINKGRSLPYAP